MPELPLADINRPIAFISLALPARFRFVLTCIYYIIKEFLCVDDVDHIWILRLAPMLVFIVLVSQCQCEFLLDPNRSQELEPKSDNIISLQLHRVTVLLYALVEEIHILGWRKHIALATSYILSLLLHNFYTRLCPIIFKNSNYNIFQIIFLQFAIAMQLYTSLYFVQIF